MAKKKLSLTPFARLFLVLLIAGPLSYIGASYYNGEDGVENIKNLIGLGAESSSEHSTKSEESSYDLKAEIKRLRKEVESLKAENKKLRKQVDHSE